MVIIWTLSTRLLPNFRVQKIILCIIVTYLGWNCTYVYRWNHFGKSLFLCRGCTRCFLLRSFHFDFTRLAAAWLFQLFSVTLNGRHLELRTLRARGSNSAIFLLDIIFAVYDDYSVRWKCCEFSQILASLTRTSKWKFVKDARASRTIGRESWPHSRLTKIKCDSNNV